MSCTAQTISRTMYVLKWFIKTTVGRNRSNSCNVCISIQNKWAKERHLWMNNLFVSPITRFLPEILLYFLFTHVLSAVHPWANIQGETTKYWFADFSYLLLFMLQTVTQYPTEIQCTHEQVFGKELWNGRYLRDPNSIIFLYKSTASFFISPLGPGRFVPMHVNQWRMRFLLF